MPLHSPGRQVRAERAPALVSDLQQRINAMQSTSPPTRALPTHSDLARLLPGGSFREGTVYQVLGSTSLLALGLAAASASGAWTALVGCPNLGAEALAQAGVRLERTAIVPSPGEAWLSVVSALADALPLVAVRLPRGARLSVAEVSRLSARLRERGSTLLVDGDWPGAEAQLRLDSTVWSGLIAGHGILRERQLIVLAQDRSGRVRRGPVALCPETVSSPSESLSELVAAAAATRAEHPAALLSEQWRVSA